VKPEIEFLVKDKNMLVEKHHNFLLEESSAIVSCTRQQALEEWSLTIFKKRKGGWCLCASTSE
jgi:hypothetical protein